MLFSLDVGFVLRERFFDTLVTQQQSTEQGAKAKLLWLETLVLKMLEMVMVLQLVRK